MPASSCCAGPIHRRLDLSRILTHPSVSSSPLRHLRPIVRLLEGTQRKHADCNAWHELASHINLSTASPFSLFVKNADRGSSHGPAVCMIGRECSKVKSSILKLCFGWHGWVKDLGPSQACLMAVQCAFALASVVSMVHVCISPVCVLIRLADFLGITDVIELLVYNIAVPEACPYPPLLWDLLRTDSFAHIQCQLLPEVAGSHPGGQCSHLHGKMVPKISHEKLQWLHLKKTSSSMKPNQVAALQLDICGL